MAVVSRRIRFLAVVIAGFLISTAALAYQKIFGGRALILPQNKFIVGQPEATTAGTLNKTQEIAAVVYNQTPAEGIAEVIRRTGNLDFIKPGEKVLIKPNVNSDDPAPGTTHPEALAEVVRQVKSKGAYVIVGDRSNPTYKTIPAMKATGIYDAAKNAGADEIVGFEDEKWVRVSPMGAKNWPNGFRIPERLQTVDHIISVPVLHTHSITGHSLAIKNLVGLIHPTDRMLFHASPKIEEMIAEISLAVKPGLTIIDGTKSFITGGPSHGQLAETKVYLASKDVLAADVFGVSLLSKHGAKLPWKNYWESRQIKHFQALNISSYSPDQINESISSSQI